MKRDENKLQDESVDNNKRNKRRHILTILGTTLGVYFIMKYLLPLVVPFIFAYIIASAILPITRFLERKLRIPKTLSGGFLLVIIFTIFGFVFIFLTKNLLNQIVTLITNIPVYQAALKKFIDSICVNCDGFFKLTDGQTRGFVDANINIILKELQTNIMPAIREHTFNIALRIIGIFGSIIFLVASTLLMIHDADVIKKSYTKMIFYEDIKSVKQRISGAGIAYFKAQLIIMSIVSVINVSGLILLKNKYALLIGIAIAIVDAFPVLGSGTIFIPWAIISIFTKDIFTAAILLSLYLLCQLVRQILEPRLIGDRIGIHPIFTIMAIYVGINLFGILGVILGPLALVMIKAIFEVSYNS